MEGETGTHEGQLTQRPARRAAASDPVRWVLGALLGVWSATFIVLGSLRHDRFGTFGFDLGIYDQGIWLVSRLRDPFVTVRGLNFFGHHMNPVLVLFVPAYWLGAGPKFLLVVQVLAQASGALAVFLLARDRIGERWLAVAMSAVLLLNPTYQYLTWEFFHPDALAIAPLLFAYWAAREKRWGWFAIAGGLALACKEDVALAVVVIGVLLAVRGERRLGVVVSLVAAGWFFLATRVLIPAFNGIGPFYDSFFGDFGDSPGEVIRNVITKPGKVIDVVTASDRVKYYKMMWAPVAFIPLAAPQALVIALPMIAINVLTSFPYARDYRFHYSSLVLAGTAVATVEAVAMLGHRPAVRFFLVGVVLTTSLAATVAWGPSPIGTEYRKGIWPLEPDPRNASKAAAVATVPAGAATSAIYNLVPHLSHRERVYEFPVPWCNINWGVRGENLDDPADVEWIAVDRLLLDERDQNLLDELLRVEFTLRYQENGIVVAERISPPPTATGASPPPGDCRPGVPPA